MDTGQGKFELVQDANEALLREKTRLLEEAFPQHGGWFQEGEVIELRGSRFRVKRIKPTEITLELLKRADRNE